MDMEEEFYAVLKLVSGEELVSLVCPDTTNEDKPLLILREPMAVSRYDAKDPRRSFITLKPWLNFVSDTFYIIPLSKVMTMTEVYDQNMIEMYENFVKDTPIKPPLIASIEFSRGKPNQVSMTRKMGKVGNIDAARASLEKLYTDIDSYERPQ